MIKNEIKMTDENSEVFDKKQIALAIRNSTVDDVAVIKAIKDGREAMKEFAKCKNSQLVYSTEHEDVKIEKIKHILM